MNAGTEFNRILASLPQQQEVVREDGSFTLTTPNRVMINYGTREQNHQHYACSCGCGKGCREEQQEETVNTIVNIAIGAAVLTVALCLLLL